MDNKTILDDIFEKFINSSKLFKNRDVLRHDYLPDNLPHREEQIKLLGEMVAPVLKFSRCSNIFIYGKTGTGKTAVTKHVLSYLETKAKKYKTLVKFCYVNCRMVGSEYRIFSNLINKIGLSVPFTGLSIGEVYDRFRKGLDVFKIIFIVVLDEIDTIIKVRGDNLLYELTRINETLGKSKVSIIGISNDLKLKDYLDPRVLSSLSEEEIVFRPYNANELRNILLDRAKLSFHKGVLSDGALNVCSALAAAEHGDARRALDLLRVAGEIAERKRASVVLEEHIREAEIRIEHNRVVETLKNLTLHSKLVLLSVFHLNKISVSNSTTGEIYNVYKELCGELIVTPLSQRRLSTLVNELDSMGLLNAKVKSMGRYGRTKKIKLEISRTLIRVVFGNDDRLNSLVNHKLKCSLKKYKH